MLIGTFLLFRVMRPRFRKERSLYGKLTGVLAEIVPAARYLQAAGRADWARDRMAAEDRATTASPSSSTSWSTASGTGWAFWRS